MTFSILMEIQQPSCDLSRPHVTLTDLIWPQLNSCDLLWPPPTSYDLSLMGPQQAFCDLSRLSVTSLLSSPLMFLAILLWPYSSSFDLAVLLWPPWPIADYLSWTIMTWVNLIWPLWPQTTSCDLSYPHGTSAAFLRPQPSSCDLRFPLITLADLIRP